MDFSITTALMLKVSNIKAGLNSRGGRLTAPCLRKEKVQITTLFLFMEVKYFLHSGTSNLLDPTFYSP